MAETFYWESETQKPEEEIFGGENIIETEPQSEDHFEGLDSAPSGSHVRDPKAFTAWALSANVRSSLAFLDRIEAFFNGDREFTDPPILLVEGPRVQVTLDKHKNIVPIVAYCAKPVSYRNSTTARTSPNAVQPWDEAIGALGPGAKNIFKPFDLKIDGQVVTPKLWLNSGIGWLGADRRIVAYNLKYIVPGDLWQEILPKDILEEFSTYLHQEPGNAQKLAEKSAKEAVLDHQLKRRKEGSLTSAEHRAFPTAWGVLDKLFELYEHSGLVGMDGPAIVQDTFFKVRPKTGFLSFSKPYELDIKVLLDKEKALLEIEKLRTNGQAILATLPVKSELAGVSD